MKTLPALDCISLCSCFSFLLPQTWGLAETCLNIFLILEADITVSLVILQMLLVFYTD